MTMFGTNFPDKFVIHVYVYLSTTNLWKLINYITFDIKLHILYLDCFWFFIIVSWILYFYILKYFFKNLTTAYSAC